MAQRPSPAQAEALLQARPDLVAQLRSRIQTSGLTPAQVRARLRAEGYPESLLDAYIEGTGALADSSLAAGEDIFAAVRALGIVDSVGLDSLRALGQGRRRPLREGEVQDELDADSTDEDRYGRGGRDERLARRTLELRRQKLDSGYTVFGMDVFDRATTQFDANLSGPVDANYRLGPGDKLVLILTGDVEASYQLDVTREGFIVVPQVGQIFVNNLTLGQLDDLMYARLGRVYSGVRRGGGTTRFSMSVARLKSNQVYVIGDVERPGSYRVSGAGTALSALYAAGGPTLNGSLRAIDLRRGGRTIANFDVYDYLLKGDASADLRLETGDVLFVRPAGARVRVWGEVARPSTYELKPGETLADLVRASGGLLPTAERRRVQIERILAPGDRRSAGSDRITMDVASEQLATGDGPPVPLQPGDVVRVFEVAGKSRSRVAVTGNVWTPGPIGFTPGMRLSEALRLAGGLKPDAYLGQVLVSRLQPDSSRAQLRAALRDTTGAAVNDLALADGDEIRVFSQTEFRPTRWVVISGAVRKKGRFPFREGMTMRDLVLQAGGLQESAWLGEAEIARLPENRAGGVTAVTTRVPLDSTYIFDRAMDGRYLGPPGLPVRQQGAAEVVLQPYDNVLILQQPDWDLTRSVVLTGEVKYPGRYTLKSKTEKLSDLIQRAGGFTSEAYTGGTVFTRKQNDLGRIGLDVPRVVRNPRHRDNLVLADGDSIDVPQLVTVVNVRGAVNSPVAVAYIPGRDIEYYINAAGGGNRKADLKRAYVTQPNGKVEAIRGRGPFVPRAVPEPQPGALVMVPERDPAEKKDYIGMAGSVAQVLASIVGIVAIVAR
ncbi:MAG TPA: SLBB domain-containing protein [Gemmatimonadaceae bacterium]|nr:SLBB domain-containing protein [Gemmatimonadaceae bacterium]